MLCLANKFNFKFKLKSLCVRVYKISIMSYIIINYVLERTKYIPYLLEYKYIIKRHFFEINLTNHKKKHFYYLFYFFN